MLTKKFFESGNRAGRKAGARSHEPVPRPSEAGTVYSTVRWCLDADKSRSWLYQEWRKKQGPKRVRIGSKWLIVESPREYVLRVGREQEAAAQQAETQEGDGDQGNAPSMPPATDSTRARGRRRSTDTATAARRRR
jgi:hypothetical protein